MKIAIFVSNRITFPQPPVQAAVAETAAALKRCQITPVVPAPPVADETGARQYAAALQRENYDGVVAVFPNFGDESSCLTALRDAGVPILFVACADTPDALGPEARRDAFCGKISAVNLFRQCRVPCTTLAPHTVHLNAPLFDANLRDFAAVCRVVKRMRRVRAGSIGARCTPFKTVRFDETALERYGISNEAFDLSEVFLRYRSLADDAPDWREKAETFRKYCHWPKGSDAALGRIAKLATVIDRMIAEYGLDLITLRCWTELEEELKLSPCVILSLLNNGKVTANCEVDTVNAVAMRALSLAADAPAACLDWNNNYGDDENACILFHCGPVAADLMRERGCIVDHPMFARILGVGNGLGCNQGRMKPGKFTCASGFTREGKLAFFLENGIFEETELPAEFFGCGGIARFEHFQAKMRGILRHGFPHHVSLSYGDSRNILLEAFREYLHYEIVELER